MKTRFYICRHCGNLIGMVHDSGVPVVCCGEKMEPLVPNTVDAAGEKHLPVVTVEGSTLRVNAGATRSRVCRSTLLSGSMCRPRTAAAAVP